MSCKLTRLKSYVEESLSTVYLQDRYLIVNTTRIQGRGRPGHVSERAIVFRFGHYLTQALAGDELLSAYDIDVEYNRNMYEPKRLPGFYNGVTPDLLVHRRGSNCGNLLAIEFKGWWNGYERTTDMQKLYSFVDKQGQYRYDLGLFVEIERDAPALRWFNPWDSAGGSEYDME